MGILDEGRRAGAATREAPKELLTEWLSSLEDILQKHIADQKGRKERGELKEDASILEVDGSRNEARRED